MTPANEPVCPTDGPLWHLHVLRSIEDQWSDVLPLEAVRLLQRIARVTVGWNRTEFTCSLQSLITGESADGTKRAGGRVGYSLRTAEKMLKVLREHGLVDTTRRQQGLTFILNASYIVQKWEDGHMPPVLRTPKKKQETSSEPQDVRDRTAWGAGQNRTTCGYNRRGKIEDVKDTAQPTSVGFTDDDLSPDFSSDFSDDLFEADPVEKESVREIIARRSAELAARKAAAREAVTKRLRSAVPGARAPKGVNTGDIRTVWCEAFATAFPDSPAAPEWTKADMGKAKMVFDRWAKVNGHFDEYLIWVVSNWAGLMRRDFAWMGREGRGSPAPERPTVGFVLSQSTTLENAWAGRKRMTLSNDKNLTEMQELMAKGLSESEAIDHIVTRRTKAQTKNLPAPRVRQRTAPVQPVATERTLPPASTSPKHVERRGRFLSGGAMAAAEAELFGKETGK